LVKAQQKKKEYTSIRIDPELWRDFKIEALRQDVQVSDLMERVIRKELERVKPK
jgi:predicted HicB family RNase H-like nuclease